MGRSGEGGGGDWGGGMRTMREGIGPVIQGK